MTQLTTRDRELVALGAALAANCIPCIEYHLPKAREAGLNDAELDEVLEIADMVRQVPARKVLEKAHALLEGSGDGNDDTTASSCAAVSEGKGGGCC